MSGPNPSVTRHVQAVEESRVDAGLPPSDVDIPSILAFIAVESAGDPKAHRAGSEFWGLLQMGRAAGIDVGFPDKGRLTTTQHLHGDPSAALRAFFDYLQRYEARHYWNPRMMAVTWKGGPYTARRVQEHITRGDSFDDALARVEQQLGIHNLVEYLRRFRLQYMRYADWYDQAVLDGLLVCHASPHGQEEE